MSSVLGSRDGNSVLGGAARGQERVVGRMTDPPKQPTVLLAEDHDGLREALVTMLENAGFRVIGASSNGSDLVQIARTIEANVVLVDLRMPSLNGIDVAR